MDRITEIETFVAIVEQGGFTEAAKHLGQSKSAVSKHLASLECRLQVNLLNRTTRTVVATDVGLAYYHKCIQLLSDWREADHLVTAEQAEPQGTLRVSASTDFGGNQFATALAPFMSQYPKIDLNVVLDNRFVDLTTERIDVAIRIGHLSDSNLKARKLASTRLRVVASPAYVEQNGAPKTVADLKKHSLLRYSNQVSSGLWGMPEIFGEDRYRNLDKGTLTINDGEALATAAESGAGLVYLPCFIFTDAVREGRLVSVLDDLPEHNIGIYAVYHPATFTLPKLRVFIDYLVEYYRGKGNGVWS